MWKLLIFWDIRRTIRSIFPSDLKVAEIFYKKTFTTMSWQSWMKPRFFPFQSRVYIKEPHFGFKLFSADTEQPTGIINQMLLYI